MMLNASDGPWQAFLEAALAQPAVAEAREMGLVEERSSRFAPKPALFLAGREIAHLEPDGGVDLRVTAAGWRALAEAFAPDPALPPAGRRRDWIQVRVASPADWERLGPLVAAAAKGGGSGQRGPASPRRRVAP
jgi:hypothetical protein